MPPARLALEQVALAQIVFRLVVVLPVIVVVVYIVIACCRLCRYTLVGLLSRRPQQVWGVLGAVVAQICSEFLREQRHVVGLGVPEDGVVMVGPVGVVRREHRCVGMPDGVQRGGEIRR